MARVALLFFLISLLPSLGQAQQFRTFQIMDNQGYERPMVAYTIDVPTDWSVRGEILWIKPCSSSDVFELVLDIQSPDGLSGFRIQPGHKLFWNDVVVSGFDPQSAQIMVAQTVAERNRMATQFRGSNCHVQLVQSADQLFKGAVRRPADMRILARSPIEAVRQQYQKTFSAAAQGMKVFFDGEQIDMSYTIGGQEVLESLFFSWYMIQIEPLDPSFGTFSQVTTIEPLRSGRVAASRKQQDDAILGRILGSLKADPDWQQRMNDFYRKRARQAQEAAQQRREDNELAWQQHQIGVAIDDLRNDIQHLQFLDVIRQ